MDATATAIEIVGRDQNRRSSLPLNGLKVSGLLLADYDDTGRRLPDGGPLPTLSGVDRAFEPAGLASHLTRQTAHVGPAGARRPSGRIVGPAGALSAGPIEFEVIPLRAYPGFARLFASTSPE